MNRLGFVSATRRDGSEYLAALLIGDTPGNGGDPGASPPDPGL